MFTKLKKWINENGGYVSEKIKLVGKENDRTIVSISEIEDGEKIIEIPSKLYIDGNHQEIHGDYNKLEKLYYI